ncbi:MAG TPA: DUF4352 domain-containing protein [Ktedonobacteraceae bacterium]|nr:DUF4352 domain-containing protein [Ktedonobacteraceae bacterium]
MSLQRKTLLPGGMILVLFLLLFLSSCTGSDSNNGKTGTGSGSTSSATAITTITPQLVTPKAVSGSPGTGPLVISSPTTVPGGKPGSQQIVLDSRTLIINSVTRQKGVSANSTLITLDLSVQNTSDKAIMNQSTFFQLMGPEGDAFGYQYNSSDNFYGSIAAHTTRSGTIVFQIPTSAASGLHLVYRPEIATETAIISLKIA